MTPNTHVRLSNLTRSFHEGEQLHAVLQSLDATFVRGEKVALKGRSGSGNSALLNLISGIDVPDDGEIEIDGHLITAMSERDRTLFRRKHIGFVYQAFDLLPTMTVADNVRPVFELNAVKESADTVRVCARTIYASDAFQARPTTQRRMYNSLINFSRDNSGRVRS